MPTAATASYADVNAALALCNHGDTLIIPAGNATWTTMLDVDVGITIQGAGEALTVITDNVTKDNSATSRLFRFSVDSPNNFRLTNLKIVGQAVDPSHDPEDSPWLLGHILVNGTQTQFRIDHVTFDTPKSTGIRVEGAAMGLIDNVTWIGGPSGRNFVVVLHGGYGGSVYGDGSWADAIDWGSANAVYIEDCVLTATGDPWVTNFFDGFEGQRVVIRHNSMTQGNVTSHGTDTSQRRRGSRQMEIYENEFVFPEGFNVDFMIWIRGGTGVVFNNTVTCPGGMNFLVKLDNYRDDNNVAIWGLCDGTSPYDQNSVGGTGYRCIDQPGAGTANDWEGEETPPEAFAGNALDPIYVWNNTLDVVPVWGIAAGTTHVQENRDYYVGTARPGYSAYEYPHPLQEGVVPPVEIVRAVRRIPRSVLLRPRRH